MTKENSSCNIYKTTFFRIASPQKIQFYRKHGVFCKQDFLANDSTTTMSNDILGMCTTNKILADSEAQIL